jgi:hypothetical protein
VGKAASDDPDASDRDGHPDVPLPARLNARALPAVRDVLRAMHARVEAGKQRGASAMEEVSPCNQDGPADSTPAGAERSAG